MKAVRFAPRSSNGDLYSPAKPPPPSALQIGHDIPIPLASRPGEMVIQIKSVSVIRDNLSWPDMFSEPSPAHLGNDFAGIVVQVHPDETKFRIGDQVYGMASCDRGSTWAEYALVTSDEASIKPANLSWEQAAAMPLSALTADQALFEHTRLQTRAAKGQRVLITGASGGVGIFLVQFAADAGYDVVAASSSPFRDASFLRSLGASEAVSYGGLSSMMETFDAVIDTTGGSMLSACWNVVKPDGALVSIDSASYDFVAQHKQQKVSGWKESVRAKFFIVEPSRRSMERISDAVQRGGIQIFVSKVMPMAEVVQAYTLCQSEGAGRGKIVLLP